MSTHIDSLTPNWLNPGITLGAAVDRFEAIIRESILLRNEIQRFLFKENLQHHIFQPYDLERGQSILDTYESVVEKQPGNVGDDNIRMARFHRYVCDELHSLFTSKGPLLDFLTCDQIPITIHDHYLLGIHANQAKTLLCIRDRLLADRALLLRAGEELEQSLARHSELVALIRDGNSTSEVLFEKLVKDPATAPTITKLLNMGIAQNAVWDMIKLAGLFVIGS